VEEFFNRIFPIENITVGYKGKEVDRERERERER